MKPLPDNYNFHLDYLYGQKLVHRERFMVLTNSPHIQSPANLVLLKNYYSKICVRPTKLKYEQRVWLNFKNRFLKKVKKQEGNLTCFYCKKENLIANINSTYAHGRKATLDHYLPLSKGGKKFDSDNLKVCCEECNSRKKDQLPEVFIKKVQNRKNSNV